MSNIGILLKEEISRLARREVRTQTDPAKKAIAQQRRDIAALKRRIAQLDRQVGLLLRRAPGARAETAAKSAAGPLRFSAKGLQSQRGRLELSALDFGKLLGVSAQTIYNWEREKARPRGGQLGKLAALRGIGKREAGERLRQLMATHGKTRPDA
jgi:DNA-binding transcriptional regulator YiaG